MRDTERSVEAAQSARVGREAEVCNEVSDRNW
jgi:hypothetical protein